MQQIHVKRYTPAAAGFDGFIEPEDSSWVVFIATDGSPSLWRRVDVETDDGKTEHGYINEADFALTHEPPTLAPDVYTTQKLTDADGSLLWLATLKDRAVCGQGSSEEEAVASLMSFVARLGADGYLAPAP